MTTLLFSHPACLDHATGAGHPESKERLQAVLKLLEEPRFAALKRREAPRAERNQLARAHSIDHITHVLSAAEKGLAKLDPDTIISQGSAEAALRAAGAVCAAVDAVAGGQANNAFCAIRPPGHHAETDRSMGFCLFSNAAIGALHAREAHGCERVAVIDFDVHHGNGTQEIFKRDASLFFASTHQPLIFPKTGKPTDSGVGNIVNVQLARGWGGDEFRKAFEEKVLPRLRGFRPKFVIISAGFDAHKLDPLGGLRLSNDDFNWATKQLMDVADKFCKGRIVSTLEGGYNPRALAASCGAHVETLMAT